MQNYSKLEASQISQKLPDAKKRAFLDALSEDDFRDRVVRPLYRLLGLKHLRDTCGADELGKDCLFVTKDALGAPSIVAVQTKTGSVSLAGTKVGQNLAVIHTQPTTALSTPVLLEDNATGAETTSGPLMYYGKDQRPRKRVAQQTTVSAPDCYLVPMS